MPGHDHRYRGLSAGPEFCRVSQRRRDVPGFSLLEILLVMSLMALLVVLGVVGMRAPTAGASSKAMAQTFAEELRAARARAIKRRTPVAVVLSSGAGSRYFSQDYYTLEGETVPHLSRVRQLGRDFPGAYLWAGEWPGPSFTQVRPNSGLQADHFPAAAWLATMSWGSWGTHSGDFALIFTPSGGVHGNNIPLFQGAYHLVATSGLTSTGNSLTGVCKPYTLTITPAGSVQVQGGLAQASGVTHSNTSPGQPVSVASVWSPAGSNQGPSIASIDFTPKVAPGGGPPGADASVADDGYLTLTVKASDPDGDPLRCTWQQSPVQGFLSSPIADRMEWDGSAWVSVWEWRPPANGGWSQVALTCTVSDPAGASATGQLGATGIVARQPGGRIAFVRQGASQTLCCMNADGSRLRKFATGAVLAYDVAFSEDGQRLAYSQKDPANQFQVCNQRYDGQGGVSVGLNHPLIGFFQNQWCPHGRWISNTRVVGVSEQALMALNPDTGAEVQLTQGATLTVRDEHPRWSPRTAGGQLRMAFVRWVGQSNAPRTEEQQIRVLRWNQGLSGSIGGDPAGSYEVSDNPKLPAGTPAPYVVDSGPAWAPQGDRIVFSSNRLPGSSPATHDPTNQMRLWIVDVSNLASIESGVSPIPLQFTSGAYETRPEWSPGTGAWIAFLRSPGELWVKSVAAGPPYNLASPELKLAGTGANPVKSFDWSPDGTQLAFVSQGDIWRIDVNGANIVNLTNTPSQEDYLSWGRYPNP